jgi:integrase
VQGVGGSNPLAPTGTVIHYEWRFLYPKKNTTMDNCIGIEKISPHDLRRTYAQLGYEAGVRITQISTLLGHAHVATTQKYLDLNLDLETTASDFIPLSGD